MSARSGAVGGGTLPDTLRHEIHAAWRRGPGIEGQGVFLSLRQFDVALLRRTAHPLEAGPGSLRAAMDAVRAVLAAVYLYLLAWVAVEVGSAAHVFPSLAVSPCRRAHQQVSPSHGLLAHGEGDFTGGLRYGRLYPRQLRRARLAAHGGRYLPVLLRIFLLGAHERGVVSVHVDREAHLGIVGVAAKGETHPHASAGAAHAQGLSARPRVVVGGDGGNRHLRAADARRAVGLADDGERGALACHVLAVLVADDGGIVAAPDDRRSLVGGVEGEGLGAYDDFERTLALLSLPVLALVRYRVGGGALAVAVAHDGLCPQVGQCVGGEGNGG